MYFKGSEVKYLTLQDLNEVFDIFTNQERKEDDENVEEEEEEEEDYGEAYYGSSLMKTLKITNRLNSKVRGKNDVSVCRQTSWMMKLRGLCTKVKVLSQMWTPLQS